MINTQSSKLTQFCSFLLLLCLTSLSAQTNAFPNRNTTQYPPSYNSKPNQSIYSNHLGNQDQEEATGLVNKISNIFQEYTKTAIGVVSAVVIVPVAYIIYSKRASKQPTGDDTMKDQPNELDKTPEKPIKDDKDKDKKPGEDDKDKDKKPGEDDKDKDKQPGKDEEKEEKKDDKDKDKKPGEDDKDKDKQPGKDEEKEEKKDDKDKDKGPIKDEEKEEKQDDNNNDNQQIKENLKQVIQKALTEDQEGEGYEAIITEVKKTIQKANKNLSIEEIKEILTASVPDNPTEEQGGTVLETIIKKNNLMLFKVFIDILPLDGVDMSKHKKFINEIINQTIKEETDRSATEEYQEDTTLPLFRKILPTIQKDLAKDGNDKLVKKNILEEATNSRAEAVLNAIIQNEAANEAGFAKWMEDPNLLKSALRNYMYPNDPEKEKKKAISLNILNQVIKINLKLEGQLTSEQAKQLPEKLTRYASEIQDDHINITEIVPDIKEIIKQILSPSKISDEDKQAQVKVLHQKFHEYNTRERGDDETNNNTAEETLKEAIQKAAEVLDITTLIEALTKRKRYENSPIRSVLEIGMFQNLLGYGDKIGNSEQKIINTIYEVLKNKDANFQLDYDTASSIIMNAISEEGKKDNGNDNDDGEDEDDNDDDANEPMLNLLEKWLPHLNKAVLDSATNKNEADFNLLDEVIDGKAEKVFGVFCNNEALDSLLRQDHAFEKAFTVYLHLYDEQEAGQESAEMQRARNIFKEIIEKQLMPKDGEMRNLNIGNPVQLVTNAQNLADSQPNQSGQKSLRDRVLAKIKKINIDVNTLQSNQNRDPKTPEEMFDEIIQKILTTQDNNLQLFIYEQKIEYNIINKMDKNRLREKCLEEKIYGEEKKQNLMEYTIKKDMAGLFIILYNKLKDNKDKVNDLVLSKDIQEKIIEKAIEKDKNQIEGAYYIKIFKLVFPLLKQLLIDQYEQDNSKNILNKVNRSYDEGLFDFLISIELDDDDEFKKLITSIRD